MTGSILRLVGNMLVAGGAVYTQTDDLIGALLAALASGAAFYQQSPLSKNRANDLKSK